MGEERVTKLWQIHADWIKKTHVNQGDNALEFYQVCKSKDLEDPTQGPNGKENGKITIACAEHYTNKAGLDNHFAMFHAGHECADFGAEFGALMETGKVQFGGHMYGSELHFIMPKDLPQEY